MEKFWLAEVPVFTASLGVCC